MPLNVHDSGRHASSDVIFAIIAIVLQLTLGTQLSIAGGSINFLAAFALAHALHAEPSRAVLVGFACGLLYDLMTPVPMGLLALLLTLASFVIASMSRGSLTQLTSDAARIIVGIMIALFCIYAVALLVMGVQTSVLMALIHGVVTALLSSVACALLVALSSRTGGASSSLSGKGLRSRGGLR